jgi:hypothetical protein
VRRPELRIRLVAGPLVGEQVAVGQVEMGGLRGVMVMHRVVPGTDATGCARSATQYQGVRAVDAKRSWNAQPCTRCWQPRRRWTR